MKSNFLKIAILIFSVLTVLCFAELVFRVIPIANPELNSETIWQAQKSNINLSGNQKRIKIGDYSFREDELAKELFGEEFIRILFLGDSFTEGKGIKNDYDRFSEIIEAHTNSELKRKKSHYKIHIFNAGKGGTSPIDWHGYFKIVEPIYKPHYIFSIFFLRDGTRLGTSLKYNKGIIDPINKKFRSMPFYSSSYLLRFFYNKFAWQEYTNTFKSMLSSSYLGSDEEQAAWRKQQRFLLKISEACKQKGIPFHLIIFPLLFNLKNYEFMDVEKEIISFAERHDISVYSLTPGFLGYKAHTLWVASNDQHPNEKGHRIAAKNLFPFFKSSVRELTR